MAPRPPRAVSAGLEAVRANLEDRVNAFHDVHSEPLSNIFDEPNIDYELQKARSAAYALLPGQYRGNLVVDRIGNKLLLDRCASLLKRNCVSAATTTLTRCGSKSRMFSTSFDDRGP